MTHGNTYNKSPRRINHKATKSKTNTGTTALERSAEQITGGGGGGGVKALLQPANFTLGPDATLNTETLKNSVQVCDNHRGISLLSIAGKVLARVLLNRLNEHLEQSELLPVWIQERQRNNRHDLYSRTASRKMPGTECGPLHDLCRPYQRI